MLPGGRDCDTQVQGRHLPRSIASGPWGEASDVGRDIGASGGSRSRDLPLTRRVLLADSSIYQLSYRGTSRRRQECSLFKI